MPRQKLLVSIIVPVYNVEEYIVECIQSIVCQTYTNIEVIIVNDGTKDSSIERLQPLLEKHIFLKVVTQKNQGLSGARNTGLNLAKGDYIAFIDSDDKVSPNYISNMVDLAYDTQADIVRGSFQGFDNRPVEGWISDFSCTPQKGTSALSKFLNESVSFVVWSSLYKMTLIDRHNLRFTPGILLEDGDFTTRAYLHADTVVAQNFIDYYYRIRPGSILTTNDKKRMSESEDVVITKFLTMSPKDYNRMPYDQHILDFTQHVIYMAIYAFMRDWTSIILKGNIKLSETSSFKEAITVIKPVVAKRPIKTRLKFNLKLIMINVIQPFLPN